MTVEFMASATAELEDAVEWYDQQSYGRGNELRAEVTRAIERILIFPNGWARLSKRTRRCQTKKFPYGVIYQVRGDTILIVAIAHLSRKPGYWQGSVGE